MRSLRAAVILTCLAGEVLAAPAIALRPVARDPALALAAMIPTARRPAVAPAATSVSSVAPVRSLRPALRPAARVIRTRLPRPSETDGKICGDRRIRGERIGRVRGRLSGCGIASAVRVTSISGVRLSTPSVMECGTAKALRKWIDKGAKPAVGRRGGGLAELKVAAHYACRTRNSRKGAKLSEHAKGRAIDISGLRLRDGTEISVLRDWGRGRAGRILKSARRSACGTFGTVLGPGSDRHHRDHFHFDTLRHRGGAYCR